MSWLDAVKPVLPKTGSGYIRQARRERMSAYPGRSVVLPEGWLPNRKREGKERQKSADAIVPAASGREGLNTNLKVPTA